MCLQDKIPTQIPQINVTCHTNLGRSLGNLSTIATAMRAGGFVELPEILAEIKTLRSLLTTASASLVSYCVHDNLED
jgi:hypothetical protein